MSAWLAKYWYVVWALVATGALVAFRMRTRGGDEPFLRRFAFALFPHTDPTKWQQGQLSARTALFLGGGVLVFTLAYLLFLQSA